MLIDWIKTLFLILSLCAFLALMYIVASREEKRRKQNNRAREREAYTRFVSEQDKLCFMGYADKITDFHYPGKRGQYYIFEGHCYMWSELRLCWYKICRLIPIDATEKETPHPCHDCLRWPECNGVDRDTCPLCKGQGG